MAKICPECGEIDKPSFWVADAVACRKCGTALVAKEAGGSAVSKNDLRGPVSPELALLQSIDRSVRTIKNVVIFWLISTLISAFLLLVTWVFSHP
jgi:Zn ribbon nucleic-acid-binding protein